MIGFPGLNEISGGCEKKVPLSGSFWSNFKFLWIMDLTDGCVSEWVSEWLKRGSETTRYTTIDIWLITHTEFTYFEIDKKTLYG